MNSKVDIREGKQHEADCLSAFFELTKCPPSCVPTVTSSARNEAEGFFRLGGLQLYGCMDGVSTPPNGAERSLNIDSLFAVKNGSIVLPFNPTEVIENLRREKYVSTASTQISYIANTKSLPRRIYYAIRPLMPVKVRRHLQRMALQDWSKITFPSWPVDTTVENLVEVLWRLSLEAVGGGEIPFIWYWPESYESCAIMTHDVETGEGQDFCGRMLEIEREHGIRSAFEVVPEVRYVVSQQVLEMIRRGGCEVCVHGLNHDGRLFSSEELFRSRAKAINQYAKDWGAKGFRSPVMYRNLDWYDAFCFSYDMSVPNVAHLDPQRGGCCTVFPYFVGDVLELPLTTIQDYPLYNILRIDPMEMWSKQMETIAARNGLMSFIIHPDYTIEKDKQALYGQLLKMIRRFGEERNAWLALPGEVDTWWRERATMRLELEKGTWVVRGKGSERASVAYAAIKNGRVTVVPPERKSNT